MVGAFCQYIREASKWVPRRFELKFVQTMTSSLVRAPDIEDLLYLLLSIDEHRVGWAIHGEEFLRNLLREGEGS